MLQAVRAGAGVLTGESADSQAVWRRDWEGVEVSSVDGRRLIQVIREHRCLPLILMGLQAGTPDADLKYPMMGWLRQGQASLVARSIHMTALLKDVLGRLTGAGLRAIPFKGPAMAAWLYGDSAFRPSEDLDIWIHPDDFLRAGDVLAQGGFVPQISMTPAEARDHMRAGWDRAFRNPAGDVVVELCTGVCPEYFVKRQPPEWTLDGTMPVRLEGVDVLIPSPEISLLWLSIHGAKHEWERIAWLVDIHLLLHRTPGLDWSRVWLWAGQCGAGTMVTCAVEMTRCLFPGPDAGINPPPAIRRRTRIAVDLIQEDMMVAFPPALGWRMETRIQWLLRERWRDRLRYSCLSLLTPGYNDWKAVSLPNRLRWIYWLIRPIRLVFFKGNGRLTAGL